MSRSQHQRSRGLARAAFDRDTIRFYGVPLTGVGEDDDVVIVGHIDDWRRVVAALNAFSRRIYGMSMSKLVGESIGVVELLVHTRRTWATLALSCKRSSDPDHPADCRHCRQIQAEDWWLRFVPQDTPGAFPITVWNPHD